MSQIMGDAENAVYLPTEVLVYSFKFSAEIFVTSVQMFSFSSSLSGLFM
jgi:hypothetical protein